MLLAKSLVEVAKPRSCGRSLASSEETGTAWFQMTAWVGTERGHKEPVHIPSEGEDLLGDLKQASRMSVSNRRSEAPESDPMK